MARPIRTGKQSVNLVAPGARTSRIRRDPPPAVEEVIVRVPEERDRQDMIVGIAAFALAIFVIMLAFAAWSGWSPRAYTVQM